MSFGIFLHLFNKCLDKHTPLKTVSKKEERVLQKPWITNGIKTSIKIRDKLYKQIIKQKDAILKSQKQIFYKRYCNKVVDLLKITKEAYYKKEKTEKNTGKTLEPCGVASMKLHILRKAVKQFLHHLSQ